MESSQTTRPNHTASQGVHVHFLLDRSGSMGAIASDVIGGFNDFLREQQARPGTCRLTLVQFDSQDPFEVLTEAQSIREVPALDARHYHPRGATPLFDALGGLLDLAERRTRGRDEIPWWSSSPTASRTPVPSGRYRGSRSGSKHCGAMAGPSSFLGANQDAYQSGGSLGINSGSTSGWFATSDGSARAFASVSRSLGSYRAKDALGRSAQRRAFFEGRKEGEESAEECDSAGKNPTKQWSAGAAGTPALVNPLRCAAVQPPPRASALGSPQPWSSRHPRSAPGVGSGAATGSRSAYSPAVASTATRCMPYPRGRSRTSCLTRGRRARRQA